MSIIFASKDCLFLICTCRDLNRPVACPYHRAHNQPLPTLAATVINPGRFVLQQGFLHDFQLTASRVAWTSPKADPSPQHRVI